MRSQAVDDHEDTPDNRPDPTDQRNKELEDTNDDISLVFVKTTSDDSSDTKQEEVQDTADDCDGALAGSILGGDLKTDLLEDVHHLSSMIMRTK